MSTAFPSLKSVSAGVAKSVGAAALGTALLCHAPIAAKANERHAAIVVDANNGRVLYQSEANEHRYPASLTKMMTLYLLFEAIESGRATLSTSMPVSSHAAGQAPSKLGLKPGSTLTVEEAICSIVTKSANDAAVVVGEYLGGTETRFAQMMNEKARQLGMSRTTFRNANGLPNSDQMTTARDMATLGIALREHFPREYAFFKTKSYDFRGHRLANHNRVMFRVDGVDGIKTGFINASGFNVVTSIVRGDKKLVAVVMGGRTARARDDEMVGLLQKYLPLASSTSTGALVASMQPLPSAVDLPKQGPVPSYRAKVRGETIESRIALAYASDAGETVAAPVPSSRPLVGREAIRAALFARRQPAPARMQIPVMNSLAPVPATAATFSPAGPVPPAAIPGGADLDPTTTGAIAKASSAPSSGWVVQIAAVPSESQALEMLNRAKERVGGPLSKARPFVEAVGGSGQTLQRARFAGFETKDEAWDACSALKRRSYSCYAVAVN